MAGFSLLRTTTELGPKYRLNNSISWPNKIIEIIRIILKPESTGNGNKTSLNISRWYKYRVFQWQASVH
jgi:hypothetical protein